MARKDDFEAIEARVRAALVSEIPADLAARHLAMMTGDAGGASVTPIGRKQWKGRRVLGIAVAASMCVMLMGANAVAASQDALPGDLLYGVKRAAERVELAMQRGSSGKAKVHLKLAGRRLAELGELLDLQAAGEPVDVAAAMRAYRDEVAHVESDAAKAALDQDFEALLAQILENLQKHVDRLTYLRDNQVPEQARDAIQGAIDNAQNARDNVGRGRDKAPEDRGKPDDTPGNAPGNSPSAPPGQSSTAPGRAP